MTRLMIQPRSLTKAVCLIAILSVVGILNLSGCGLKEPENTLTVYSGRSEKLIGPLIKDFEKDTKIEVAVKYASTAQLANTLREEGKNSNADVFFAQDPGSLGLLKDLFIPIPTERLDQVPNWARANNGAWVGVSGRVRTLVYNTQYLSGEALPKGLKDLIDSNWNGRIGWAPGNASFIYMVTAMRMLWGESETRTWLEAIQLKKPQVYPNNSSQVVAAANGEIDIGMVNHYYVHRFLGEEGETFGARNHYLTSGGPGSIVMISGVGILKSGDNEQNAREFIRYLLSKTAQEYFANQTFEYPLIETVNARPGMKALDDIVQPAISPESIVDLEQTQRLLRELGIIP